MNIKNDAIFYHIYPLGFCGAPHENGRDLQIVHRIKKVEDWISHMKDIGINALYIGPVFESSTHGYDTIDYYKVDRRLGDNDDLKNLCHRLHENGIKVVLDAVFNHVGRDFFAFKDIIEKGQNSQYLGWFSNLRFDAKSPYGDNFTYDSWEGHYNLVKLNLYNQDVENHILGAVKFWIDEFDIDGLRLDSANSLNFDFIKKLSKFCKAQKQGFWLMGEVIHGDYNRWANEDMLDSVTNYECYKGLYSSHNSKNYFEIAYSLNRQFGDGALYKNIPLYNFVDNHDVNRLASTVSKKEYIPLIYTLLFTMPGVPSIYYGSEWGIEGVKENNSDYPLRPEIDLDTISNDPPIKNLVSIISKLALIRKNSKALRYGSYRKLALTNEQFAFARILDGEAVITALNLKDKPSSIEFDVPVDGCEVMDLINQDKKYEIVNKKINLQLGAFQYVIIQIK